MSLVVLDPGIFLPETATGDLAAHDAARIQGAIDHALLICRSLGATVPTDDGYWIAVETELIRPILSRAGPNLRQRFAELRRRTKSIGAYANPFAESVKVWGFKDLFDHPSIPGTHWRSLLQKIVVRSVNSGRDTYLVTARILNRNVRRHESGGVVLDESTCWRVGVQIPGWPSKTRVPCVQTNRNVAVPWTSRFDERLPDASTSTLMPFCPPVRWWDGAVRAVATLRSKPTFLDKYENGWTRPSTGGGHHWDVFLELPAHVTNFGIDRLNVTQHGAPPSEGQPGTIHHIPAELAPYAKANPARIHC